jgi:hypothetical protein
VRGLLNEGIKTAVIGLGGDTVTGTAPSILNAIATEGGAPRSCPGGTDAECGFCGTGVSGCCDQSTHRCQMSWYWAQSSQDLSGDMALIGYDLSNNSDVCVQKLDTPPDSALHLTVLVNGTVLAQGPTTWSYDRASGSVTFLGATCAQLKNSTPGDAVNLEFETMTEL